MGRPKGSKNKGFDYVLRRGARDLAMKTRQGQFDVEELSSAALAYASLLKKALRVTSPEDPVAMQRLGTGLAALSKAFAIINRLQPTSRFGRIDPVYPLE